MCEWAAGLVDWLEALAAATSGLVRPAADEADWETLVAAEIAAAAALEVELLEEAR